MSDRAGRKNAYRCEECGEIIVTVDRDAGTTPAFMTCKATECCRGRMTSAWYQLPGELQEVEPDYEWYAPDDEELEEAIEEARERTSHDVGPGMRGHVENGGLLLRPTTPKRGESDE